MLLKKKPNTVNLASLTYTIGKTTQYININETIIIVKNIAKVLSDFPYFFKGVFIIKQSPRKESFSF
jgi:hypothetical protein